MRFERRRTHINHCKAPDSRKLCPSTQSSLLLKDAELAKSTGCWLLGVPKPRNLSDMSRRRTSSLKAMLIGFQSLCPNSRPVSTRGPWTQTQRSCDQSKSSKARPCGLGKPSLARNKGKLIRHSLRLLPHSDSFRSS